jgi:predicted amidophosphoribosyltransferase
MHQFQILGPGEVNFGGRAIVLRSFFWWKEDEALPVSKLMMALKNGGALFATRHWGQKLALDWAKNAVEGNWCVVAAPRQSGSSFDHAYWLAKAVAETLNLPLFDCLRRPKNSFQKRVSKTQRRQSHVVCHEKISENMSVLFVDDIITTGATAELSFKALSMPAHFEILTLARRDLAAPRAR